MSKAKILTDGINGGKYDELLKDIYVDRKVLDYQKERYIKAIEKYVSIYGDDDLEIYSAPGRSEIGGNHTDHQQGEVLAASINLDAIAVCSAVAEDKVRITSGDYPEVAVDLNDLALNKKEEGTTKALIKGVLAGAKERGFKLGGFKAYITSDVLIGAGLSSSAAFETVVATIISYLYNDGKIDSITAAIIGQYAENVYFGKPCGLMDQMACSVGNLVHVDFFDKENPKVEKIDFDMDKYGYSLCITDTLGSHADLTADYAAVPIEMKQVANYFGKDVLRDVTLDDVYKNIKDLREKFGDRPVLRTLHFITENDRVRKEVQALKDDRIVTFFKYVKASGNSSFKYLQNVYTNSDVMHQNVSMALAVSEIELGEYDGVSRVHGGGFAGTIQAFVKNEKVDEYKERMDMIFNKGACKVLKIRKYGGMKVM